MKTQKEIEALANDDANKLEVYQRDSRGNHITGFIAGYTACQDEDRWVPVSERLPDSTDTCYAYTSFGKTLRLYYDPLYKQWYDVSDAFYYEEEKHGEVTHWQYLEPLPNPPKK